MTFWLGAPNPIHAQTDTTTATSLREVVVTATKFAKPVSETGKVVTIIDEEQIARSRGKDLAQLLHEQAGLIVAGANSNPGKDKSIFLRGAAGKYTLILIDGVPVNDPSGVDGAFDIRMISLDQVERIEILKGSQSTLYGTDALAGVINIITRKKSGKSALVNGTLGYGSFNTLRLNAGVSGSTDAVEYDVNFSRLSTDGLSEAKDTIGNFDKDGMQQQAFQATVGYRVLPNVKLRPFLRYTEFKGDYDMGAFADDPSASYTGKIIAPGLQADWKNDRSSATLLYSYNRTQREFRDTYGTYPYDGRFHHAEAFFVDNPTDWFQILTGVTWQHFEMITQTSRPSFAIINPYFALFVRNKDGFSAEVSGRLVSHTDFGQAAVYSVNPSYLLNNKFKVFANLSSAFKTPVLNQLYGPFGANPNLKPEYARTVEAGVHYLPGNNLPELRATWFARNIQDAIVYTTAYENRDELRDRGVELEAFYRINRLTVQAQYQYLTGKEITPTETRNNPFYRRPRHMGGVNVAYQITDNLLVSANMKSFGKRNDVYFDLNTFTSQEVVLDPFTLLDVYAEYRLWQNKLRLFVDARNVLNAEYFEAYGYTTQPFNIHGGVVFGF
ncbi:MAG: TonB-dependent receptor [Cyclobacteriaceae bacterium]|nr:TonB-dependent receptor [Cyclobacteriaceae bacterium]